MLTKIYCLPGTMCDERLWGFVQQELGSSIVLCHLPIPQQNTIDGIVAELAETLPQEPVNLLGFSMGGYVASAFSVKYPDRIKRLMVLSNTASGLLEKEQKQREVALNWVAKQGYKGIPKKKAAAMLGIANQNRAELIDIIVSMDEALGEAVFIQQLTSSLIRPDLLPALAEAKFALCFVVGSDDVLLSTTVLDGMKRSKSFDVRTLEQCGHMLPLEEPVVLAGRLKAFFE